VTGRAERRFHAQADELAAIDEFISEFGKRHGLSERVVFRARVCVAELAANALEHGGPKGGVDHFMVEMESDGSATLNLTYADTTAPFDPATPTRELPDVDDNRIGGRGLKIVQNFADALSYRRLGSSNFIRLRFEKRNEGSRD